MIPDTTWSPVDAILDHAPRTTSAGDRGVAVVNDRIAKRPSSRDHLPASAEESLRKRLARCERKTAGKVPSKAKG